MKFLKIFFSKIVSKIRSLWSSLVGGKKPSNTEPLLPNAAFTPEPTPVDPRLIATAQDPLKQHLPPESRIALSHTSRTLFEVYKLDAEEKDISELASRVLWNRPNEVKKLLGAAKSNQATLESLLTKPVTMPVTLPSGLLFKGHTPFQAALCTWNTALCEEFKKYFEKIDGGTAIMQAQINQIFPNGDVEAYIEKQKADAEAFKANILRPLIATISTASQADVQTMLREKQSDSDLGKAIAAFREEIKKVSDTDPVYNPFYLLEAYNLYNECFNTLKTWNKRDLFCVQGFGGIQCYSSACDLQAFAQGLFSLIQEEEPFEVSFKFKHVWGGIKRLEINVKDFSGLGVDYWAGAGVGVGAAGAAPGADWPVRVSGNGLYLLESFIKQKQQALRILCVECSSQRPVP